MLYSARSAKQDENKIDERWKREGFESPISSRDTKSLYANLAYRDLMVRHEGFEPPAV